MLPPSCPVCCNSLLLCCRREEIMLIVMAGLSLQVPHYDSISRPSRANINTDQCLQHILTLTWLRLWIWDESAQSSSVRLCLTYSCRLRWICELMGSFKFVQFCFIGNKKVRLFPHSHCLEHNDPFLWKWKRNISVFDFIMWHLYLLNILILYMFLGSSLRRKKGTSLCFSVFLCSTVILQI